MSPRLVFAVTIALVGAFPFVVPPGQLSAAAHHIQSAADPPGGDLPVRVAATSYKGSPGIAWVLLAIEVDAGRLRLHESNGSHAGRLEVTYAATDAAGRQRSGTVYDGMLTLDEENFARAGQYGIRALTWLELPIGYHELRVSVRSARRSGIVVHHVQVPDFGASLSMSGVSVAVQSRDAVTVAADEAGPLALPEPTARRTFQSGDSLVLFAEVYESGRRLSEGPRLGKPGEPGYRELGDHTTHLVAELRSADGVILMAHAGRRQMDRARPAGRHAFSTVLPLDDIAPGDYLIRVRARANIGPADTATEEFHITVQ